MNSIDGLKTVKQQLPPQIEVFADRSNIAEAHKYSSMLIDSIQGTDRVAAMTAQHVFINTLHKVIDEHIEQALNIEDTIFKLHPIPEKLKELGIDVAEWSKDGCLTQFEDVDVETWARIHYASGYLETACEFTGLTRHEVILKYQSKFE